MAFADDVAGQITASTGLIEAGLQGTLGEGEHVSLGNDGCCSILVDHDSLVELCGDTSLVLRKEKHRRIVVLERGEILGGRTAIVRSTRRDSHTRGRRHTAGDDRARLGRRSRSDDDLFR